MVAPNRGLQAQINARVIEVVGAGRGFYALRTASREALSI
jgi:hypothetical protein